MGLLEQMGSAIDAFYAAALGQGDWHAALDGLLRATGYTHASVYASNRTVRHAASKEFRLPVTGYWHNHDPATQREYECEYYKHEASRHYRLAHPDARIIHDLLYDEDRALDRNPFYAWAERQAGLRYFMLGQTDPGKPIGAVVSLHRPRGRGPTDTAEIERFHLLLGHLERAIQIEHHMGGLLAPGAGASDFLERNPAGIVLIDGLGNVVLANRAARTISERADAVVLHDDRLTALRGVDDGRLQRLIGTAIHAIPAGELDGGGMLRLPRRSGRRSYAVVVGPVSRRDSILSNLMPAACVLITDPESEPHGGAEMLRRTYGLTPMETRLVERLAAGDTTTQAAATLGILPTTMRSHLSAVFRKTETRRQQDLMRLIGSLPSWMT